MHNAAASLPLAETSDTLPPEPDAALCGPHPVELPSPRASHYRVLDAALPDLTLATVLRLLAHVATPGNGLELTQFPGTPSRPGVPWFHVRLSTNVSGEGTGALYGYGYGTPEKAVQEAFEDLAAKEGPVDVHDPELESERDLESFDRCFG